MRTRRNRDLARCLMIAAALAGAALAGTSVRAQEEKTQQGRIVIGVRQITGERGSSKFTEYRHIPTGFFLQGFELQHDRLFGSNFFFNFQTRESLERDQSYLLGLGVPGKFRFDFRWAQTPHVFTNTGRSLFVESSPGTFTVPTSIRTALQNTPAELARFLEGAPLLDVSLRRKVGTGTFTYTPNANWALLLQYSREKQTGVRPFGTTTNSFSNVIELPEPINYRTHQVKATAEYVNRLGGVQIGYSDSIFENKIGELVWDNPFRVEDAAGAAARGQLDLYPDNRAHSLSFAGALNLGASTRLMASIVPGWMRQNDAFLPFTLNTALSGLPPLPASSLDGKRQTLAMNYTLTNSALPAWTLTARYRSYDYNNNTSSFVFTDYVRTDASLVGMARRNLPYAYDRKNLGLEASRELAKGQFLKLGYDWERWGRQHRDVEISNEHTVAAVFDSSPKPWMLLRTSYRRSERRPSHYEANEESFPLGEGPFALGQIHGLRKFDEAARGRDRAEALLQIDPTEAFSVSASYGTTQDRYRESLYGLLKDINYNFAFDITYAPRPEFALFAEYTREKYKYLQRSRQRVPTTATAPANDSANNDWQSDLRDFTDTWGAGVNASLFNNKVLAETFYSLSAARGSIRTWALGSPGIPGFLVTTAQDYPNTNSRFHQVAGSIKFRVSENFHPRFDYRYEKYGRMDFQIDRISPFMVPLDPSANTSIFLGADVPGYNAHVIAFTLEYRF